MTEVKYRSDVPGGPTAAGRIHERMKNSGGGEGRAHTIVKTGDGVRRTFHNIHQQGQQQMNVRPKDTDEPTRAGGVGMPKGQATGNGRTGYYSGRND